MALDHGLMRLDITEYQHLSDSMLVSLMKKGDRYAFTEIYGRYIRQLYTLTFRYIKNDDDTQDILQQLFEKLWVIKEGLGETVQIRSYLYAMARNSVLNYMRNNKNALQHNYIMVQQRGDIADDLYAKAEEKGMMEELIAAIKKLPEQQRKVAMYRCEGLSNNEIAKLMNLSLNTVNSHYKQCLKNLKKFLAFVADSLVIFISFNV